MLQKTEQELSAQVKSQSLELSSRKDEAAVHSKNLAELQASILKLQGERLGLQEGLEFERKRSKQFEEALDAQRIEFGRLEYHSKASEAEHKDLRARELDLRTELQKTQADFQEISSENLLLRNRLQAEQDALRTSIETLAQKTVQQLQSQLRDLFEAQMQEKTSRVVALEAELRDMTQKFKDQVQESAGQNQKEAALYSQRLADAQASEEKAIRRLREVPRWSLSESN